MATNYESAEYFITDQEGTDRGPYFGKAETKLAAIRWQGECGDVISIRVIDTNETVAILWDNGEWLFPDLHDDNGNRLPYRIEW